MSETPTDWEHFYVLGVEMDDGHYALTSWAGDMPTVERLVLDCAPHRIPYWDAAVPEGAKLVAIPADPEEYVALRRERGGRKVLGWVLPKPIKRKPAQ